MTPFTQFLGHLVELVGAEIAAQTVRQFAGQTIQFPITDHYDTKTRDDFGFPVLAPVLGAGYARPQAESKAHSLLSEPHRSAAQASAFSEAQSPSADRESGDSSPVLPPHATQPESAHSAEPLGIESQALDLSGS